MSPMPQIAKLPTRKATTAPMMILPIQFEEAFRRPRSIKPCRFARESLLTAAEQIKGALIIGTGAHSRNRCDRDATPRPCLVPALSRDRSKRRNLERSRLKAGTRRATERDLFHPIPPRALACLRVLC